MTKVRTGRRYRTNRADDHYDVIIVGSGIGGLTNAALLSLLGKKVCVLEQHYTAGGYTHAYEREGYEWDVGVHYIGDVHKPTSTMRRIFDVVSEGRLQWAEMEPVYDRIILGDKSYDLVAGKDNFIRQMVEYFPEEEQAIRRYVALITQTSRMTPKFFAAQAMPVTFGRLYNSLRPLMMPPEFFKTTREVLEELTANQELISVLTGQWGDYGMVPDESAFVIHALVAKHYLAGGAYPVGGASAIARTIIPTIQKSGGEVFTYADVEQILIRNNAAYGVRLANGDELTADQIVSNVGFVPTVQQLLPEQSRSQFGMERWLDDVQVSSAHLCLYAGFKGTPEELGMHSTNLWIYPDRDHEGNVQQYRDNPDSADFPIVYISFPSSKDPDWLRRYPGKSTVEIVTVADMKSYERWQDTEWAHRGEDYEAYKEGLSRRLLKILFERMPQLEEALDFYELSTPLSTKYFQKNVQGEIYGLEHFVERFKKPFLHPKTPVKNLYLTGVDVMTAGVGGGLMAGVMTSCSMLGALKGRQVMRLLKEYRVPDQADGGLPEVS